MIRFIGSLCLAFLFSPSAIAQKQYFIYLQTEDRQHFTLKLDNKLYNSTSSGYLILPRLKDSTYNFSIILPGEETKEQRYAVDINGRDHGFLIKNFSDKGWGLYDLQTSSVQYSKEDPSRAGIKTIPRKVSAFTQILALAARDPSLLETEIVPQNAVVREVVKPKTEEKPVAKSETETPKVLLDKQPATEIAKLPEQKIEVAIKTNEEQNTKKNEPGASPGKQEEVNSRNLSAEDEIKKKEHAIEKKEEIKVQSPSKTEKETLPVINDPVVPTANETGQKKTEEEVVVAKNDKKEEPVKLIEEKKPEKKEEVLVVPEAKKEKPKIVKEEKKQEPGKIIEEKKEAVAPYKRSVVTRKAESSTTEGFGLTFTDEYEGRIDTIKIIIPNPRYRLTPTTAPKEEKKFLEISTEAGVDNKVAEKKKPACKSSASEKDFLKLRKEMAAENGDDAMITEARKAFKQKCYSVEQIRNLSTLFLDDGGKYKFFDESYMHVSDIENFTTLEKEIRDSYYLDRFKAMLR